jgi:SAM-dependent methyltransferase
MASASKSEVNYWPQSSCARAFWSQQELPAYQKLLADTAAWLDPHPGDAWLDLGCGCGQLSQALWTKSQGSVARIVAMDCALENEKAFQRLQQRLLPVPRPGQITFQQGDFSTGLAAWAEGTFHGVVSGLAIQYAESYSVENSSWTTAAYDQLLKEIYRVLRPGGWFVFSVNVPEPAWGKVALRSLRGVFRARQPGRFLANAWLMMRYGSWLKREARRGRFHYLPLPEIVDRLSRTGFEGIEHRVSYVGQAYLVRCCKPK